MIEACAQEAGARAAPTGAERRRAAGRGGAKRGDARDLLLAADHRGGVPAGVHAHRAGRAAVPAAGLHQDLRDADLGGAVDHLRARAARRCSSAASIRPESTSTRVSRVDHPRLRAVRVRGAAAAEVDAGRSGCSRWRRRCRWRRGWATSSCRRSTRATSSTCRSRLPDISIEEAQAPAAAAGPDPARLPRGRDACSARSGAPRRRPIRRRSPWSRRRCACIRPQTSGASVPARAGIRAGRPAWRKRVLRRLWPESARSTWDELTTEMNERMQFPGWTNAWTMPIKTRVDMLTTGVRTPVGVKVFGTDSRRSSGSASRSSACWRRSAARAASSTSATSAASTSTSSRGATALARPGCGSRDSRR